MEEKDAIKESELDVLPSKSELRLRKILGIFILLLLPLTALGFFNLFFIIALPIAIYLIVFGIYLLKDKRYHLIVDFFFTFIGFVLYFYYFHYILDLRYFALISSSWLIPMIGLILTLSASFFLFFDDILSKFWQSFKHKGSMGFLIFLLAFSGLFLYPVLQPFSFPQKSEHATGVGANMFPKLKIGMDDARYEFNSKDNLWVYQIKVTNSSDKENVEILKISAKKLPESSFSIIAETIDLAPPFDNIKVSGGEKIGDKIVVKPLAEATIVINSPLPLLDIIFQEKDGKTDVGFGKE
ncbi:MAG TPA: hypothetical protein PK138_02810 [Candidatus Paceibacterota bacterium]|nr:hypothetical protein [Candidatus Paceibacterota bacterium]